MGYLSFYYLILLYEALIASECISPSTENACLVVVVFKIFLNVFFVVFRGIDFSFLRKSAFLVCVWGFRTKSATDSD